ncbi:MAG: signal peptidase II [Spirochaetes bacterium]|nr:signal peptidase II [Spirochaetota bacterium]
MSLLAGKLSDFSKKLKILLIFMLFFTTSDLIVKVVVNRVLKGQPEVVVIENFWHFSYVENDDIGFSFFRRFDDYLKIPQAFSVKKFESILVKAKQKDISFLNYLYQLDSTGKEYHLGDQQLTDYQKERLDSIFSEVDYRPLKWILMVLLQGLGSLIIILMYFTLVDLTQVLPLALIISGAFGNLIDRIIRGGVVDFVDMYYKDFHWPTYNLADLYMVIGAIWLMITVFFVSDKELSENTETSTPINHTNENKLKDQQL